MALSIRLEMFERVFDRGLHGLASLVPKGLPDPLTLETPLSSSFAESSQGYPDVERREGSKSLFLWPKRLENIKSTFGELSSHSPAAPKTAMSLSLTVSPIVIGAAIAALVHGLVYYFSGRDEAKEFIGDKEKRDLKSVENSQLSDSKKEFHRAEALAVQERNLARADAVTSNRNEAAELKKSFLNAPHFTPAFLFDYERLFEGVPPNTISAGKAPFDESISRLRSQVHKDYPRPEDLRLIFDEFVAAGPQEDTISHAADALALKSAGVVGNCVAKAGVLTMALMTLYPESERNLFVQEFKHHERLIYMGPSGQAGLILEGGIPSFPDKRSGEVTSRLIPLNEYWRSKLGVAERELQGVRYLKPKTETGSPSRPVITDRLDISSSAPTAELGEFLEADVESLENAPDPKERRAQLQRINEMLQEIGRTGGLVFEVEIIGGFQTEVLRIKESEEMIARKDFFSLHLFKDFEVEATKKILLDPEFQRQLRLQDKVIDPETLKAKMQSLTPPHAEVGVSFGGKKIPQGLLEAVRTANSEEIALSFSENLEGEELKKLMGLKLKTLYLPESFFRQMDPIQQSILSKLDAKEIRLGGVLTEFKNNFNPARNPADW